VKYGLIIFFPLDKNFGQGVIKLLFFIVSLLET